MYTIYNDASTRNGQKVGDQTQTVKLSEEDMITLKKQIIDTVRECAGRSSLHAFPSLATKGIHPIIIVIWVVCLLASWGYLIYQIYNSIVLYYTFGVSSTFKVSFEVILMFQALEFKSTEQLKELIN